jgi:hypothetical protein
VIDAHVVLSVWGTWELARRLHRIMSIRSQRVALAEREAEIAKATAAAMSERINQLEGLFARLVVIAKEERAIANAANRQLWDPTPN